MSPLPATLLGLDFSSAPSARKPLVLARGTRIGAVVRLDRIDTFTNLSDWATWLREAVALPDGFVMGCDFPFGLPRPFVEALRREGPASLPHDLAQGPLDAQGAPATLIRALHAHCVDRAGFQRLVDGWGQDWQTARPAGSRLIHRRCDQALPGTVSTSPLQTRYVPVGKMYFEGLSRLVDAGVTLPGMQAGQPHAIALEAYPGLLATEVIGRRSYKSETDPSPERLLARMDLVDALEQGRTRLGLRLKLTPAQRDHLAADPKGDRLDAVLCLIQAAWAHAQAEAGAPLWGLPDGVDPVEGWILTA